MPKMSNARLNRIRRALLGFYDAHRRALPWRVDPQTTLDNPMEGTGRVVGERREVQARGAVDPARFTSPWIGLG